METADGGILAEGESLRVDIINLLLHNVAIPAEGEGGSISMYVEYVGDRLSVHEKAFNFGTIANVKTAFYKGLSSRNAITISANYHMRFGEEYGGGGSYDVGRLGTLDVGVRLGTMDAMVGAEVTSLSQIVNPAMSMV